MPMETYSGTLRQRGGHASARTANLEGAGTSFGVLCDAFHRVRIGSANSSSLSSTAVTSFRHVYYTIAMDARSIETCESSTEIVRRRALARVVPRDCFWFSSPRRSLGACPRIERIVSQHAEMHELTTGGPLKKGWPGLLARVVAGTVPGPHRGCRFLGNAARRRDAADGH